MNTLVLILTGLVAGLFSLSVIVAVIVGMRVRRKSRRAANVSRIMEHALQFEHIGVLRFQMSRELVTNIYGHTLPDEGITTKQYIDTVHPDDRHRFSRFLTELSLGQKSTDECSYRFNVAQPGDEPQWVYLHNSAVTEGRMLPRDIVCTLRDVTDMQMEQQQESDLALRYQSIFRRSVVGLAIYDAKGMMMAANDNLRELFNLEGDHDPYYYNVSLFSRQPFRDLVDTDEVTELHFCSRFVLSERGINKYMELQLHPIRDDVGTIQNYSLAARDVTEERKFYLKNRQNNRQIIKANEAIQQYETELQYLMEKCDMRVWKASFRDQEVVIYKQLSQYERKMTLAECQEFFVDHAEAAAYKFTHPEEVFSQPVTFIRRMRSIFHDTDELVWDAIDSIPIFSKDGHLEGCFGTIRNITPLMKAQEMLKEETKRANDSARLKTVFMANMTHEIRTPLNSIVGFSDLLPMIDDPEQKQEMIRVIMNNCDMLLRLINDILEISTMDKSAIIITPEEVDFAQTFNDLCESLRQRVQEPAVSFLTDNPYTTLIINVDPRRIQQVITNFVTNAVKYTHEGHIKVGYRVEDNALYLYCEDTGAGIPKEKQASVFERFVKLNDYVQGTGLGLSICKAIAERCNGEIGVISEGEGHGSTFWLRIPVVIKKKEEAL